MFKTEVVLTVTENGTISGYADKPDAIRNNPHDKSFKVQAKYLGLPEGTKLKITIEQIED